MSTMRGLVLALCVSTGVVSAACADEAAVPSGRITFGTPMSAGVPTSTDAPASLAIASTAVVAPTVPMPPRVTGRRHLAGHIRPHDKAHGVVRLARADGHEPASVGVNRMRPRSLNDYPAEAQRVAVLDRPRGACDSLLCPGYAMLGVGF